jgi:hypothetical protein
MQRTRGYARPLPGGGQGSRSLPRSSSAAKSWAPCSPAVPVAVRVGMLTSPRIAAGAPSHVASPAILGGGSHDSDEGEDRVGESHPLLSPPAHAVAMTNVCDWAQAIQCTYSTLKPMPCQRRGAMPGNSRRAVMILLRAFVAYIILKGQCCGRECAGCPLKGEGCER